MRLPNHIQPKSFFALICILMTPWLVASPEVIFVTGPSSSGKTTLAKALQESLDPPYVYLGLDTLIGMMPQKVNQWGEVVNLIGFGSKRSLDAEGHPLAEIQMGPFAQKMRDTFKDIASVMVQQGHHVVIDDVFFSPSDRTSWEQALEGCDVYWIKLTAPLPVLELREQQRGDRALGSARSQLSQQRPSHFDLEINTADVSVENSVKRVKERLLLSQ